MEKREVKVQVNHLTKRFGDLLVLDDISFEINKGEFVCIVGPTGCGKTTFLNLLTGLLEPTEGEILIDGERADPKKHSISFVFQEPSAFPWLTAQQNIEYGLRIKKKPEQEIVSQREKIIGLLGLEKYRDAYPHEMSVSMEQRVVIGRAFALNPDLLLMDEPYGQMDIKMRYYLEEEFKLEYPGKVAAIRSEEYYVNMARAWYFATALAKKYDQVLPFLEEQKMDVWTHNKTIQKAIESYRITPEQKEYLRTLKIRQ